MASGRDKRRRHRRRALRHRLGMLLRHHPLALVLALLGKPFAR